MSRVCRSCGERKESDQYKRGTNGTRLATCNTCRDKNLFGTIIYAETRDHMRSVSHEWMTVENLSQMRDLTRYTIRTALNRLVKHGMAESREVRYRKLKEFEYKLTPAGVERLALLESMELRSSGEPKQNPVPKAPKAEVQKPRTYFAWLDLYSDQRPNYADNNRYVSETSGLRSFLI